MKINTDVTRRVGVVIVLGLSMTLFGLKSAYAESKTGFYVKGQLGLSAIPSIDITAQDSNVLLNKIEHNLGWNIGAALGYRKSYVRIELEEDYKFAMQKESVVDIFNVTGSSDLFTVMANVYIDMFEYDSDNMASKVIPYIGAGMGLVGVSSRQKVNVFGSTIEEKMNKLTFGVQALIGVQYYITKAYALDFKYKLLVVTGSNFETNYNQKLAYNTFATSTFNVGLSYHF